METIPALIILSMSGTLSGKLNWTKPMSFSQSYALLLKILCNKFSVFSRKLWGVLMPPATKQILLFLTTQITVTMTRIVCGLCFTLLEYCSSYEMTASHWTNDKAAIHLAVVAGQTKVDQSNPEVPVSRYFISIQNMRTEMESSTGIFPFLN